ncbi:VOC family protein [Microbacterium flavum]|uniref:VOC family protein n=1 Tax=Microbacterium flavum TaxID=415216 RepID=A0ABS5XY13_9MICO|nr:VOC family protein [Microbacterium flavum]MBT8799425.1 VOC family protein [Microbacterium flavum]
MPTLFINMPVTDLDRAKAFWEALGFEINPAFTDHNAACVIIEKDHSYAMIVTREFYQTFTDLPLGDPAKNPTSGTSIFVDSREEVDAAVARGIAAGGREAQPAADYGFMYQRNVTDPDGNIIDFGWMDPVAAEQGPAAYMESAGIDPHAEQNS